MNNDPKKKTMRGSALERARPKKTMEAARPDGTKRGYAERQPGQQPIDEVPEEQVEGSDGVSVIDQEKEKMERPDRDAGTTVPLADHPDIANEKRSKDDPGSVRGGARNPVPEV